MFWVVIHVAVEYCWTMLNPYPRNPRISNKWNNYTFKCQVLFLHYMQVSLAPASVHSIQSHRWCIPFMTTGGLLASSFADAYTDDAGVRWSTFGIFGEVREETITPRDVSVFKFGTCFLIFLGPRNQGGSESSKIPWFQRMEVNPSRAF